MSLFIHANGPYRDKIILDLMKICPDPGLSVDVATGEVTFRQTQKWTVGTEWIADLLTSLGFLDLELERPADARHWFATAVALNPASTIARDGLQRSAAGGAVALPLQTLHSPVRRVAAKHAGRTPVRRPGEQGMFPDSRELAGREKEGVVAFPSVHWARILDWRRFEKIVGDP